MKNTLRPLFMVLSVSALLVMIMVYQVCAAGPKVSELGNKHNLSNANTDPSVKYKASGNVTSNPRGSQVCIFCHTPHNANVVGGAPLWSRKFSAETFFQTYSGSLDFQIKKIPGADYGQPDGSSKLCLSCHDGASNLGELKSGEIIPLANNSNIGNQTVIEGFASFKSSTNKMRYGHHPVSFKYDNSVLSSIISVKGGGYLLPVSGSVVKLDGQGKMQCTTCHNAHQNQSDDNAFYPSAPTRKIAPFWVYNGGGASTATDDQRAVCETCHPMSEWTSFTRPMLPTP